MKLFLYVIVFLTNFGLGSVFYISAKRMAESGASPLAVTATMSAWAATYMAVSLLVSRFITEKNASRILGLGGLTGVVISLCMILFTDITLLYAWLLGLGAVGPLYCAAAQVLIKRFDSGTSAGILKATGKYTFSWSTGVATGPFVTGFVWSLFPQNGWMIPVGVLALNYAGMMLAGFLLRGPNAAPKDSAVPKTAAPQEDPVYRGKPALVMTGWILGAAGGVIIAVLRSYLPYKTNALSFDKAWEGVILALISYSQALVGLSLAKWGKYWMYSVPKMVILCLCGVLGLLLFAWSTVPLAMCGAAVILGIFSGMFYMNFVFMSMLSRESAKNLSINEAVVGATGTLGPLAGGWVAAFGLNVPFYGMAVMLALATVYTAFAIASAMRRTAH